MIDEYARDTRARCFRERNAGHTLRGAYARGMELRWLSPRVMAKRAGGYNFAASSLVRRGKLLRLVALLQSFDLINTIDALYRCANRQTARCSMRQRCCVMEDLLQYIDGDYYRSARLLIARAEIAQLRRQASAVARSEQPSNISTGACPPVGAFAGPQCPTSTS